MITEVYGGNYSSASFKAFTQAFTQSEYSPMKVIGAKNNGDFSAVMSDTDAVNARYALIAPEAAAFISCNKELDTVIGFAPDNNARVYSAKYDANGRLVDLQIKSVNCEDYYVHGATGDGYVYKFMLWNCEDGSMQPLCEAVTAEK